MPVSFNQAFTTVVDGVPAGRAEYIDKPGTGERFFYHTEIDGDFSGRGLAGQLVDAALTRTAAEELDIVAVCPYVSSHLEKHPDSFPRGWRKPRPADLTWLKGTLGND